MKNYISENTINGNIPTITENTTLAELIDILGSVTRAAKTPTSRKLREEAGEPIAESDGILVYSNGYGVYVEVPNLQGNIPAVLAVMRFIYDNIMYAELNTKSDYCQVCGYDGEIRIVEEDGKLIWECPNCGNRDQKKMNVCRRVCGYLGTQYFNQGRTAEIADRVMHLSTR